MFTVGLGWLTGMSSNLGIQIWKPLILLKRFDYLLVWMLYFIAKATKMAPWTDMVIHLCRRFLENRRENCNMYMVTHLFQEDVLECKYVSVYIMVTCVPKSKWGGYFHLFSSCLNNLWILYNNSKLFFLLIF